MVVSTWPDTFQVVEPTRDPIRVEFSERISERPTQGHLDDAVLISPFTGEHRVKHTRSGLEISLVGGLRPGLVYRVRIGKVMKDMFGNSLEGPFEWVFSTGGEFQKHVLAGIVRDRITGEKVEGARVEARAYEVGPQGAQLQKDGPVYVAVTDTAGIFIHRHMPGVAYQLQAYRDNNRNREPDFREPQALSQVEIGLRPGMVDTLITEVAVLQPDTSAAEVIRVEAEDSTLLKVTFDDFLMPQISLEGVLARLALDPGEEGLEVEEMPDGPAVAGFLWPAELDSIRAVEDSIRAADSLLVVLDSLRLVADSLEVALAALQAAGDTLEIGGMEGELERIMDRLAPPEEEEEAVPGRPERPPPGGAGAEEAPPPFPLPENHFFVRLAEAMVGNQLYRLTVSGVQNVNGLLEGGGGAGVTWVPPEAPPEDPVAADTAGAPADTTGGPADTTAGGGISDTLPDTTRVLPGAGDPPGWGGTGPWADGPWWLRRLSGKAPS